MMDFPQPVWGVIFLIAAVLLLIVGLFVNDPRRATFLSNPYRLAGVALCVVIGICALLQLLVASAALVFFICQVLAVFAAAYCFGRANISVRR